jgi:hypothetical protein
LFLEKKLSCQIGIIFQAVMGTVRGAGGPDPKKHLTGARRFHKFRLAPI